MTKRISEIIGQRFGRVTIIGRGQRGGYGNGWVRCKCDCGQEFTTMYSSLMRGYTRSCGCLRKEVCSNKAKGQTKPVRGYKDGVCVEYPSLQEAARAIGKTTDGVCRALRGKQHTAGGYRWEYA